MSDMTLVETSERWSEGLKKAAARCRELGRAQDKTKTWNQIAISLDSMREQGEKIIVRKGLSRSAILESLDKHTKDFKAN